VQEARVQRAMIVRAARRIQVGVCAGAFAKWAETTAERHHERLRCQDIKSRRLILVARARGFRRMSCIRFVFVCWKKVVRSIHSWEFAFRTSLSRLQTERTCQLVAMYQLFHYWRSFVVKKSDAACSFFETSLLRSTFTSFRCWLFRRRSRAKELVLACTLIDQVRKESSNLSPCNSIVLG
jgi:hypothetical protein